MSDTITIARPYAQAVFALARESGDKTPWAEQLALAAAVVRDPQMQALIHSPRLSAGDLAQLIIDVCGEGLDEHGRNLIRTLAANRRLAVLPEIEALYARHWQQVDGEVHAVITTAYEADETQQTALATALKRRLGREVSLECRSDPALIGGAVIRIGDQVIDGSLRGKLDRLSAALSH